MKKTKIEQMELNSRRVLYYLFKNKNKDFISDANAVGVVLALRAKVKYVKPNTGFYLITVLLFLDLRTARVERYLINSSDPKANEKGTDFKKDLYYTWNDERYKLFHDDEHEIEPTSLTSSLGNGKFTSKFFTFFMSELLRDYLVTETSFFDGNIATLRKITKPIKEFPKPLNFDNKNLIIKSAGTGELNEIEKDAISKSSDYSLPKIEGFKAQRFFNNKLLDNSKAIIYVPKQFKQNIIESWYFSAFHGCKLVYANMIDLSQIVKDLNRTISMKTLQHPSQISSRIQIFNYNVVKNLKNWSTKIDKSPTNKNKQDYIDPDK